jgi:mono/diheme cytochrome c family protein
MKYSTAYEANVNDYYYYNTWGTEDEYHAMAQPRKPVPGTIARGDAGMAFGDKKMAKAMMGLDANGAVPYHYEDTEEERLRATAEIVDNPYPITDDGLARGKELYTFYCGICHGDKGDGNGYLVSEDNPNQVYPAQPANFLSDEFVGASNGRYYHAMIYGKNVMGGYTDKLSYEERWQVLHHIRSLQAKEKGKQYSEKMNSLNDGALTLGDWKEKMGWEEEEGEHESDGDQMEHHSTEDHNGGHH